METDYYNFWSNVVQMFLYYYVYLEASSQILNQSAKENNEISMKARDNQNMQDLGVKNNLHQYEFTKGLDQNSMDLSWQITSVQKSLHFFGAGIYQLSLQQK